MSDWTTVENKKRRDSKERENKERENKENKEVEVNIQNIRNIRDRCDKCKIQELEDETNLLVVIKKIRTKSKEEVLNYFLEKIQETPDLIYQKNEAYDSNILHEIVYEITLLPANDEKYDNIDKYIIILEYLATLKDFISFLEEPNAANEEKPYEVFERRWLNKSNDNKAYQRLSNIFQLSLAKKTREEILRDREAGKLTKRYHQKQKELFRHFEKRYKHTLTCCSTCNATLNYFGDFETLGNVIVHDPHLPHLTSLVLEIIRNRETCSNLYPDDRIKANHLRIVRFFKRLYLLMKN